MNKVLSKLKDRKVLMTLATGLVAILLTVDLIDDGTSNTVMKVVETFLGMLDAIGIVE